MFLNLTENNGANFTLGVIHRQPEQSLELFNTELNQLLFDLTKKKKDIILIDDFSIDLLKCQKHSLTNSFYNYMASYHFLPTIIRPTRITSHTSILIDNIYNNSSMRLIHSAIITYDISDHLPIAVWFNIDPIVNDDVAYSTTRILSDESIKLF